MRSHAGEPGRGSVPGCIPTRERGNDDGLAKGGLGKGEHKVFPWGNRAGRPYSPVNTGWRFSRKALIPSP